MSASLSVRQKINSTKGEEHCKEEYYYRSIFEEHFPSASAAKAVPHEASVACSTAKALEWDEAWKNMNDPSGRAVSDVHEQAY